MGTFEVLDFGVVPYEKCYSIQKELLDKRIRRQVPDTLILCEHPPVMTMGTKGKGESLLVSKNFLRENKTDIFQVERGGDVTYHCPGQIVGYPIFNLYERGRDIHEFLHNLEDVIISTLREYGFEGQRRRGYAGIWVNTGAGKEEVGFIGIAVKKWVAYHGFSINVNPDLTPFSWIIPCGIKDAKVTSLSNLLGEQHAEITMKEIKKHILRNFEVVFGLTSKKVN